MNRKEYKRFNSGGIKKYWKIIINKFIFGVIIIIENIIKRELRRKIEEKMSKSIIVI